ncbi:MAG: hypothetical protein QOE92_1700 [Chloroflexota bacterium]|jgi:putative nucleotidyltransferase with HDIG domain|nr:hypothetical protein [Chloroflexota bacterium]
MYRVRQAWVGMRARPDAAEVAAALEELPAELRPAFRRMAPRDQVHALRVLDRVGAADPLLRQAALLHDAGKAAAPLGTMGRSLVVLAGAVGGLRLLESVPVLGVRVRRYVRHPEIGAEILRAAGAAPDLVEIVAEHQEVAPRHQETLRLQAVDGRE